MVFPQHVRMHLIFSFLSHLLKVFMQTPRSSAAVPIEYITYENNKNIKKI